MGARSDTADSRYNPGHLLYRSALGELLKTTEFRYLEIGILNITSIIEKNLYLAMPLKPGNRVNTNLLHFLTSF